MRKLPAAAQEERWRQVVGLRENGLTFAAIAAQTGLTENGVSGICRRHAEQGLAGLASGPRGPAPGTGRFLSARQETEVCDLIRQHLPDALGLPCALWSRAEVRALVEQRCGVRLAVRSTGTCLARWGFTAQKPLRRAYEQSAEAVQRWLRHDYSAIAVQAKREKGAIFSEETELRSWGDETGLRYDDVCGRSFAPRGHTPVVRLSQRRARLGLISALTNKGEMRWMLLDGAVKAPVLIRFMQRLVQEAGRKVFLVLDPRKSLRDFANLPVHRACAVQDWLAGRRAEIEVFHLPPYSPELNPDEGLNADLKQAATRKPPARSKPELKRNLIGSMRSLSKRPGRIRSYFGHQTFRYAA